MRSLFFVFILSAAFCSTAFAQQAPCTSPYDVTPIVMTQAAIQTAVTAASDGDVLCLAAGTATFTSQIDITAVATINIEIRGAGTLPSPWGSAGLSIIYSSAGNVFGGYEVAGTTHYPTIDNIKFTIDASSESSALVIGNNAAGGVHQPWIIHHNDFAVTGTCNHKMITLATNHGVIYRNRFTSEALASCTYGFTNLNVLDAVWNAGDTTTKWESASTFGSADTGGSNNIYLEDNYISGFLATDLSAASRTVIRFNEMHSTGFTNHGFDSNPVGARAMEFYNNALNCDDSGLGHAVNMSEYVAWRGGTGFIFGNTFQPFNATYCSNQGATTTAPVSLPYFKDVGCDESGIAGWPGSYPDTYPASHLPGWGWINATKQTVGAGAGMGGGSGLNEQGQPGGAGFQQSLEPFYFFTNTNNTGNAYPAVARGAPECRAMAYSNTGKTSGTTLKIPDPANISDPAHFANPYWNVGQEAVVVFSDLVGGSAPTIADSLGNSWTLIQGGTNSGMRLTAWHSHITTAGAPVITITFGSSSAARAGTLVVMRGMTASPLDKNPAVLTANSSPYLGPFTDSGGAPAQTNEIVLGYYALNGPIDDGPGATALPDKRAASCATGCTGTDGIGIAGTTGSTASTNTVVGVIYRAVTTATGIQPSLTDSGNPNGLAGTITFKVTGNDVTNLDLAAADLIQADREYFNQASGIQTNSTTPFNGTTGTGWGTRANRPTTCTFNSSTGVGVAYWSTDQGSWNTSGIGGQGVLDKCTATNTWTNAWYVPYDYPHTLAMVTGGSCTPDHLAFTAQPSSVNANVALGTVSVSIEDSGNNACTSATDTITIANKGGTCTSMTLGGTKSGAATSGVFTTTNLTEDIAGSCTLSATASGLTGADSSAFTISAAPPSGTGGGLKLKLRLKGFVN